MSEQNLARSGWRPVDPPQRPVLFVNPRSGDGTAARLRLAERARDLGIEVVILTRSDSFEGLVRSAVESGADALGMAGGDGSLAIVAEAAAAHGLPFICIPAGTRNHFALDLGVDRHDVLGALDAFTDGVQCQIDVAEVNGRLFLNNVSLGIYGEAVRRAAYRDAKVRTLVETAEKVLAPHGEVPALRLVDDAGREHAPARGRAGVEQPLCTGSASLSHPPPAGQWPTWDHRSRRTGSRPPPAGAGLERTVPGRACPGAGTCRYRWRGGGSRPAAAFRDPAEGAACPDLQPPSGRLAFGEPAARRVAPPQAAAPKALARSGERATATNFQSTLHTNWSSDRDGVGVLARARRGATSRTLCVDSCAAAGDPRRARRPGWRPAPPQVGACSRCGRRKT